MHCKPELLTRLTYKTRKYSTKMSKRPDINKDLAEVEYVEAEPIEPPFASSPSPQPMPFVRTYSSTGCVPCCGPFGCLLTLIILSYFFYEFEFLRAVAIAGVILLIVSVFAGSLTRGTR